ncbi:MAG TPA: alpha-L-arabinofuranosidase C-terminal domain-containing protein, partial [Niabella sp.]|nr:alpha-L-arabinofuranosidase C-terminal domain-containing protein [Niabella sp.]
TPTYYVFDMYKNHMDAKWIPFTLSSPDYVNNNSKLPAINVSASIDSSGKVNITLVNIDSKKDITIHADLNDKSFNKVSGRILTSGSYTDINTFENKNKVIPASFTGATISNGKIEVKIPKLSVVSLQLY